MSWEELEQVVAQRVLDDALRVSGARSLPWASRTQDLADVEALVRVGADVAAVLVFLREYEPHHVPSFSRIAQRALLE